MMCPSFLLLCPTLTSSSQLALLEYYTKPIVASPYLSISLFHFLLSRASPLHLSKSVSTTSCVHLMKRSHGDFTPSNSNPFEDPKVRFRHHSLMQDYQELHMDTQTMRKKLQTMQERKATLMAEVRFLRRRYRHLRQESQPVMQPPEVKKGRGRSNGVKKSETQLIRVEVSPTKTSEAEESKHVSLPDLNHSGMVHHDETRTKKVPLFDLNQISGEEEEEEEEMNNSEARMRVEQSSSCKRMNSMEMLSCRNGGTGSHKRKSSWQDPVAALRV